MGKTLASPAPLFFSGRVYRFGLFFQHKFEKPDYGSIGAHAPGGSWTGDAYRPAVHGGPGAVVRPPMGRAALPVYTVYKNMVSVKGILGKANFKPL